MLTSQFKQVFLKIDHWQFSVVNKKRRSLTRRREGAKIVAASPDR